MKSLLGIKAAKDYRGWRYAIEQKYFIGLSAIKRNYWAVDAAYLKVNYNSDGIFQQDSAKNTPEYTDNYHINKRTLAFNIKRGMQVPIKNFIIYFSAGIGIKYKMTVRSGLKDVNAIELKSRHPNAYEMANRAGRYLALAFLLMSELVINFESRCLQLLTEVKREPERVNADIIDVTVRCPMRLADSRRWYRC